MRTLTPGNGAGRPGSRQPVPITTRSSRRAPNDNSTDLTWLTRPSQEYFVVNPA